MSDHIRSEDLAAYVDGLLSAAQKSELENHFSRCPVCLDELAEVTAIRRGREKIPAHLLRSAMAREVKTARSPLQLRLVFEVAAAMLVVVFIGYLFLSGNRFWQPAEQQKPSQVIDENDFRQIDQTAARDQQPAPQTAQRLDRGADKKSTSRRNESDTYAGFADAAIPEKIAAVAADKDLSAVGGKSMPTSVKGDDLSTSLQEQPALEEPLPKKSAARTAAKPPALGEGQLAFATKERSATKVAEAKAVEAEQNSVKQNKPEAIAARPSEILAAAGTAQTEVAKKKRGAAPAGRSKAPGQSDFPFRIDGDVGWSNLQNPELVLSWSWFPKDLALELQIDRVGTVTAVLVSKKVDERLAAQAASEAKKLLFTISEKKSRRARLVAKDAPPD